jgi:hypothetical protein
MADGSPPGIAASVVFAGSVLAWSTAYLLIIYRGFKDRTYGMPMPSLAGNLSWEAIWAFVIKPFSDLGHILTIPWFCIDVVIAWQCLAYGRNDATDPFLRRYHRWLFAAAVAIAFPLTYLAFKEFDDWYAEYTAVGGALLMSILFIGLLIRRGVNGQSIYIGIAKCLGTLLAWIATSLTVTMTVENPWPTNPFTFVADTFTHTAYPLTPMITFMYAVTFVTDVLYIFMLRTRLRDSGISVWRRA